MPATPFIQKNRDGVLECHPDWRKRRDSNPCTDCSVTAFRVRAVMTTSIRFHFCAWLLSFQSCCYVPGLLQSILPTTHSRRATKQVHTSQAPCRPSCMSEKLPIFRAQCQKDGSFAESGAARSPCLPPFHRSYAHIFRGTLLKIGADEPLRFYVCYAIIPICRCVVNQIAEFFLTADFQSVEKDKRRGLARVAMVGFLLV